MSKTFRRFDEGWKEEILTCPDCGWQGIFNEGIVEIHEHLVDSTCPECDWLNAPILAKLMHMTIEDAAENLDKLSKHEREFMNGARTHLAKDSDSNLRFWYELPEIDESSITIKWHGVTENENHLTLLLYNEEEIWREKAVFGGSDRLLAVAAILKYRYGDRLADLVPTEGSVKFLMGDDLEVVVCIKIDAIRSSIKVGYKRYQAELERLSSQQADG